MGDPGPADVAQPYSFRIGHVVAVRGHAVVFEPNGRGVAAERVSIVAPTRGRMDFRILGPLEVVAEGRALAIPSGQQRTLLALLVVNANRVLSPDRIADALWGERQPASGTKALAFHVSRLRDALAPGRPAGSPAGGLETEAGGYVLRTDPESIDAVRFERLMRDGHRRLVGAPEEARALLLEALELWRGEPLVDVAYADFAQAEVRRLKELRLSALEDRLEADLALGNHLAVVAELEALLAGSPLRERLRGLLMLALYRSGRQAEALRVAGEGRRLLSEELGIEPSPELAQLEARILGQDPMLEAIPGPGVERAPVRRNPYKGLRAFGEADSGDFFGREALVGRLLARLDEVIHDGRLLVVVGPSGSGKSSVVRAGLVPAVRAGMLADGDPWRIATMVPGVAPFHELAAALSLGVRSVDGQALDTAEGSVDLAQAAVAVARRGERLLLVIDQLEELFVRVDEEARARFIGGLVEALTAPAGTLVVVATLRADFLHVPLVMPELGELLRAGIELVTPMTRSELEHAIVRPAQAVGAVVEPGLVADVIADVEHRPGVLPLLEYALTELYDRSDGWRLTRDGYAAIGGATGALGRRAEEAWRTLDREGREIARQVLLRLVALADRGAATTGRVPRAELESLAGSPDKVRSVLDDLGRRGLLAFDLDPASGAPMVQIVHEALLAHWSRLADWIEDEREDLWTRRRLADAADEWEAAGRSPGYLIAGARLERLETWARGTRLRLTEAERGFLDASAAERERLAGLEADRAAQERRLERRARIVRRSFVGVLVVGVVIAGVLAAALVGEQQTAVEQEAIASARGLANASTASLGKDRQLSVLLALEAAQVTVSRGYVVDDAYDAMQWALQGAQVPFPTGELPFGVRKAPDGLRGVFLIAPEVLMRLGTAYVDGLHRVLSADECRTYLHASSCAPVQPPAAGTILRVRTGGAVVAASSLASRALAGSRVRILSELPADISPLVGAFGQATGATVAWDAALGGDLEARIKERDLPDVAIVSRPSYVAAAAKDGWLLDLQGRVDTASIAADAGSYAMSLGRAGEPASAGSVSTQFGVPLAASVDDLLWYPAAAFARAGYQVPTTAAELTSLVARLQGDGKTPWCFGNEQGQATGTAAADWVEDVLVDRAGLDAYDEWVAGRLAFGGAAGRTAVETFGGEVMGDGEVLEGLRSVNLISNRIAALPMVAYGTPECWLYRGASTDRPLLAGAASAPIPSTSGGQQPVLGRLYMVVILHDRPEVRQLVDWLLGSQMAASIDSRMAGDGIYPVRALSSTTSAATDTSEQRLRAGIAAGTFRVRMLDVVPALVASSFRGDMTAYVQFGRVSTAYMDFAADAAWDQVRAKGSP